MSTETNEQHHDIFGEELTLTDDQREIYTKLKEKHKKVHILKVPLDDGDTKHAVSFLKPLDRPSYSAISKLSAKDSMQGCELLINTLWVGGDDKELVTKDFEALLAADFMCGSLMQPRRAQLKKN